MFDSIVDRTDHRQQRLRRLLGASVGVHGLVFGAILVVDQLRVSAVPEPSIAISFVDFSGAPPPPPPPPPKKRSTPKKVEPKTDSPRPDQPKELLAPAEIPEKEPDPQDDNSGSDEGSEDGVEGGVEGGVVGGVIGGALPPPPPSPVFQDMDFVKKLRLQGSEPKYPPQALAAGITGVVVAKITIGVDGRVQEIEFVQTHPAFERAVRAAVEGWIFQPHVVDGRAIPIYCIYKFTFKK
jgi:periplasmic protein TonB